MQGGPRYSPTPHPTIHSKSLKQSAGIWSALSCWVYKKIIHSLFCRANSCYIVWRNPRNISVSAYDDSQHQQLPFQYWHVLRSFPPHPHSPTGSNCSLTGAQKDHSLQQRNLTFSYWDIETVRTVSRVGQSLKCLTTGWTTGRSRFDSGQRKKDFSSSLCAQTVSGADPASCTMGTGGPFPGAGA
jgi:hypothetical protein